MKIGPKYKIARRLGAPVFEKTQSPKYAISQARKEKSRKGFSRPKSEYGTQLLEKQKARYVYCVLERQFSKYAKEALAKKDKRAVDRLFQSLELRADNVVFRAGLTPTRLAARQLVSHGHILVNGRRITVPSYTLAMGDRIALRPSSEKSSLFKDLDERLKGHKTPEWMTYDASMRTVRITGSPKYEPENSLFDINVVLEFYSR